MAVIISGDSGITTPDLTDTSLTSGRVVYAGTGGNLTGSAALTFDGTNLTTTNNVNVPNTFGFKNRIINGDMRIDQRNAGASVTQSTSLTYVTDRFAVVGSVASKFTAQQSSTAATGFINSLLCTSSSAYTVGASEDFSVRHYIEGLNVSDLAWGTASASTVTLSFWVRSSLTGTFGGSIANSAQDRFYVFSYTINSANTWEQKTITIAGDTTGTWLTTNGIGIRLFWSLGSGATVSGTAGSWGSTFYRNATGATNIVGTNGATFYITGVQLEKGNIATPFDVRPYGTELALCQRYFQQIQTTGGNQRAIVGTAYSSTQCVFLYTFETTMRAQATITIPNLGEVLKEGIAWYIPTSWALGSVSSTFANVEAYLSGSAFSNNDFAWWGRSTSDLKITASAEL